MPSVQSLEKQQYYGNKRNQFWEIIYSLFNKDVEEDYDNRKIFLLSHQLTLFLIILKTFLISTLI